MRESSKCEAIRLERGDYREWLHGEGIDIGSGNDCLRVSVGTVRPFDFADGDAQLLRPVNDDLYDFVYSSHCLEHLQDPEEALKNWIRVCKPGGFLYVVVPDFTYYEKCIWPSRFNGDHKHTFSSYLSRQQVGRRNHHCIRDDIALILDRHGADLLRCWLELDGFDFTRFNEDQTLGTALSQIVFVARKCLDI